MTNAVSPEGQKLFLAISKTLVFHQEKCLYNNKFCFFNFVKILLFFFRIKEVCWQGNNILVFSHIQITPPYKSENVTSLNGDQGQALKHIRKVVRK